MQMKNYTGHKGQAGVFQQIINEIPRFDEFHELFAGSGVISSLLEIKQPKLNFLNDKSAEVFLNLSKKFRSATVLNNCAISLINDAPNATNSKRVCFLDPPYLHETRPNATNLYEFEMTDNDHIQLLQTVLANDEKFDFIIIHPKCDLYETYLKNWRKKEIKVRYHQKTSIEVIYMNYPEPTELHTYKYLGNDCWDRQRIKRKADRLVKSLSNLPVLERKYILEKIKSL